MKSKYLTLVISVSLLVSGCNLNYQTNLPTPDANLNSTLVASTLVEMRTVVAGTIQSTFAPQSTKTSVQKALSAVPQHPSTLVKTAFPALTSTPIASSCDKVTFIEDVTIPDGLKINAGSTFTKTWRLMNSGTCTWGKDYRIVFVGGTAMDGVSSTPLNKVVVPGGTTDISVNLKAPTSSGLYTGYWMLQNTTGWRFGMGNNGIAAFFTHIDVVNGTPTVTRTAGSGTRTATLSYFAVQSISISPSVTRGNCPASVNLKGTMIASKAGTVNYHYTTPNGSNSGSNHSIVFNEGGSISFTDVVSVSSTGQYALYVDAPNHQAFYEFNFTCNTSTPTLTKMISTATSTPIITLPVETGIPSLTSTSIPTDLPPTMTTNPTNTSEPPTSTPEPPTSTPT
jgi:hypothetical protein